MATGFRSSRGFPRRGREVYGEFLWLLRVFDKARAARNGIIHDYSYPCPIDRAIFERWGIGSADFDATLATCETDDQILAWVKSRVSSVQRDAANSYLLSELYRSRPRVSTRTSS